MAEYIEREAAKRVLAFGVGVTAANALDNVPAAEVEPVIYARWEKMPCTIKGRIICMYTGCTNCRREAETLQAGGGSEFTSPRCPYCGAHMKEVEE